MPARFPDRSECPHSLACVGPPGAQPSAPSLAWPLQTLSRLTNRRHAMNPETFTQRAREALNSAAQLASSRRHPELTPAHLMLALLEPQDGYVAAVLEHLGTRREQLQADVE